MAITAPSPPDQKKYLFAFTLAAFALLLPWLYFVIQLRIPGDAAFLFTGAQHILAGHAMSEYFYDNNPPMSFLIYLPAALLNQLGIPPAVSILSYTMVLIVLCYGILLICLSKWKDIPPYITAIIIGGYLTGITTLCTQEFNQKDQLISIALMPFLFLQLTITYKHDLPKAFVIIALAFLTPFILIKPHYGLLPTALLVHRYIKNKSIKECILAADTIILALGCIIYGIAILMFFPDFLSKTLPMALKLYVYDTLGLKTTQTSIAFIIFAGILLSLALYSKPENRPKSFPLLFFPVMLILSTIPFWVQNKGFGLHMLPMLPFLLTSIAQTVYLYIPHTTLKKATPFLPLTVIILLGYAMMGMQNKVSTHEDYKNSSLAKIIHEKAGKGSFFFETYSTNIFYTQTLYINNTIGSRFPSLWFLSNIGALPAKEKNRLLDKFCTMMAEDLQRYKPKLIGLLDHDNDPHQNLMDVSFKRHAALQEQWKHYKYDSTITIKRSELSDFFKKEQTEVTYNLFVRKEN